MNIKETQERILKAVQEAKKMLQKENSVSGEALGGVIGDGNIATGETTTDGITANTAPKETNTDQVGLARAKGKLREKKPLSKSPK